LPYWLLVRLHPNNANKKRVIVSGLSPRERAVRREAAEGFFALYAGRVHAARHSVQDGKKARWVVGRSLTLKFLFREGKLYKLKENVLQILLNVESEYHSGIKRAVREAENYVENRRNEQKAYIEEQKRKLGFFEETENEKLEKTLLAESERLEEEAANLKVLMKTRQMEKAEQISMRLKEEVLSLLWQ